MQNEATPATKIVYARVLDDSTGSYTQVPVELQQTTPTTIDDDVVVVHAEAVPFVQANGDEIADGPPGQAPSGGEW